MYAWCTLNAKYDDGKFSDLGFPYSFVMKSQPEQSEQSSKTQMDISKSLVNILNPIFFFCFRIYAPNFVWTKTIEKNLLF